MAGFALGLLAWALATAVTRENGGEHKPKCSVECSFSFSGSEKCSVECSFSLFCEASILERRSVFGEASILERRSVFLLV